MSIVCEPLLPSLLAPESTQHKAGIDNKGSGSIKMHLPAKDYYGMDFVVKI